MGRKERNTTTSVLLNFAGEPKRLSISSDFIQIP